MRFQWKILILFLAIALVPVITLRTFGGKALRQLGDELVARARENLIDETYKHLRLLVDGYASVIWMGREHVEVGLKYQSATASRALSLPGGRGATVFFTEDFQRAETAPRDMSKSLEHLRSGRGGAAELVEISTEFQVFAVPPGIDRATIRPMLEKLNSITPTYQELYRDFEGSILWQYTVLDNGLHSVYPGNGKIPRHFDLRTQSWYEAAKKSTVHWSDPYVDPGTRQVVVAAGTPVIDATGKVAGVTAFIIPVRALLEQEMLVYNITPETRSFLSYISEDPESGERSARIVARDELTDITHRRWDTVIDIEPLKSDDSDIFNAMLDDIERGIRGVRRMPFEGQDSLWAYGPIHTNAMLVLVFPYAEILKQAEIAKTEVEVMVRRMAMLSLMGVSIAVVVLVFISIWFSRKITKPIEDLVEGAKRLAEGDFNARVEIQSHDEFGEMGSVFNMVGPQLLERYRMRQSLDLAKGVQQNLLPKYIPQCEGLDIFGKSIYCDETGGDYFDFLEVDGKRNCKVAIVVGDVAGHGIPSALLMTTARAFIRQRASLPGGPAEILTDINRLLTRDVGDTGQFMTMFYGEINDAADKFRWVRAGHDPALRYDATLDIFDHLSGQGVPLGVFEDSAYTESETDLRPGQVLIIGTDGIRETVNPENEMFGTDRLQSIIRRCSSLSAREIGETIIAELDKFRHHLEADDDVTLVVVKLIEINSEDG
ncbi:MAG: SpoIIE family protein phosphatase [Desulfobacteraceae bacterium]|nr:SpoIIE family protein phosphatase [Desulfobacteraceae bacterium]